MMDLFELQLSEIDMLQSMFPGENELILQPASVLDDVRRYIDKKREALPKQIAYTLNISIDINEKSGIIELHCAYPLDYPTALPEIFVKSGNLNRTRQKLLNEELKQYTESVFIRGELCISNVIMWLQENSQTYVKQSQAEAPQKEIARRKCKHTGLSRLWIYSHHIYRKELLKKISEYALELDLTGFFLPGKPGIICVEGFKENCDDYWQKIKYPNWKHISCKHREDEDLNEGGSAEGQLMEFRLFERFEELVFEAHGDYGLRNDYHMDLGKFREYLDLHQSGYMFQIFFGLEGQSKPDILKIE